MLFALYNLSSKISIMSGKCKQLINISLTLLLGWNRHQNSQGMIWQEEGMAKRKTVMPKTRYGECQLSKQTKNQTRKFAKHLGEKPSSPQPALKLCSSYIPFTNVDTNVILHLLEIPGKTTGTKKKKKKRGGRNTSSWAELGLGFSQMLGTSWRVSFP